MVKQNEIDQLKSNLLNDSSDWHPQDYYSVDAVEHFIRIVRNHEADTVKEMIQVYKGAIRDEKHDRQHEEEMELLHNIEANQKTNEQLLRRQNVLSMANLASSLVTNAKLESTNSKLDNIDSKLFDIRANQRNGRRY